MSAFTRPPTRPSARPPTRPSMPSSMAPATFAGDERVLVVDRIGCDGYGTCAELLPELIALDDWGYPIIRPGAIPPHLLDHAQRAVDACPVLALRVATRPRATMAPTTGAPGPTPRDGRRATGGNGG